MLLVVTMVETVDMEELFITMELYPLKIILLLLETLPEMAGLAEEGELTEVEMVAMEVPFTVPLTR